MKDQWPLWLFVIAVIMIVLFAFNYQGTSEFVSIGDIFPESEMSEEGDLEYVFVDESQTAKTQSEPAKAEAVQPEEIAKAPDEQPLGEEAMVQETVVTPNFLQVPFTIQVASYKKREAAQLALKGMQAAGYPAHIISRDLGEKGVWYRIYIGTFDTKNEAIQFLTNLKKDFKNSFIISPKTTKKN